MEENSTLEKGKKELLKTRKANFQMHLLFAAKPELPSAEEIKDTLEKYLGKIQIIMDEDEIFAFTLEDYVVPQSEGKLNAKVIVTQIFPYQDSLIQENYVNEEYIKSFQYDIFVSDLLTSLFTKEEQNNIGTGMLRGIIDVFSEMSAIWLPNKKKIILNKEFPMLTDEEIEARVLL
ncbi:MAG: hypothetical protein Q4G58_08485 [bacterium]|nr:hypothetical protein [bacterium]